MQSDTPRVGNHNNSDETRRTRRDELAAGARQKEKMQQQAETNRNHNLVRSRWTTQRKGFHQQVLSGAKRKRRATKKKKQKKKRNGWQLPAAHLQKSTMSNNRSADATRRRENQYALDMHFGGEPVTWLHLEWNFQVSQTMQPAPTRLGSSPASARNRLVPGKDC